MRRVPAKAHRHAFGQQHAQVRGVEVRQAHMADQPLVLQPREFFHRFEPARVLEGPPVELQQVDARHAQPLQRTLHAGAHDVGGHRPGRRAPLGEGADRWARAARRGRAQQLASDDFGRAVVVGHVEGIEARRGVGGHVGAGAHGVQRRAAALLVGHLPQAGDDARDVQARGQFDAGRARRSRGGSGHRRGFPFPIRPC
jgi:hypothetical protein